MQGRDVFRVLRQIGATYLYHANSVTTSCTFLEEGGLLSRGFVEDHGLKQTTQLSDKSDKKNGVYNPVYWDDRDLDSERWFHSKDELARNINFGDFAKMLVIKTPFERLDFPNRRALIILDDPQRKLSSGEKAYTHAKNRLKATASPVDASIERRDCRTGCSCAKEYDEDTHEELDKYFI